MHIAQRAQKFPHAYQRRGSTPSTTPTCTARPTTATAAARSQPAPARRSRRAGAYGPADAFAYAKNRGLDILMASEHNHMYDGSSSTNTAASPTTAKALYQAGLKAAGDFNAGQPELPRRVRPGVGRDQQRRPHEHLQHERAARVGIQQQQPADRRYLHRQERLRVAVHPDEAARLDRPVQPPDPSGQFLVNGVPLGYTADGDQAMVLCEVLNTSAFSTNTTETETGRSSFEMPARRRSRPATTSRSASNQDNHCANWGASYTNRTGVLIPTGTALTNASFVAKHSRRAACSRRWTRPRSWCSPPMAT
jgi:hypothetical protein